MAEEVINEEKAEKKGFSLQNLGMGAWIGIAVVTLVIGVLVGHFAMGGGAGASGALGKTTLTESELDSVVGTYTYNGSSQTITAREVIEQNSTLESAQDEDGNYAVPSADTVLSVARNKIIAAEADNRGITVSDDDLASYAEETLGSSDFESIATSYSMDEETVKDLLRQSAQMSKLRDEVVDSDAGEAPEAPVAPAEDTEEATEEGEESAEGEEGAEDTTADVPTAEYAEYIINLAGDEWDAEAGTWASEDGPYATALAEYEVTNDGATYEAAQAAYYVAYQQYSEAQTDVSTQWTDFVNDLLGNASISLATLVA